MTDTTPNSIPADTSGEALIFDLDDNDEATGYFEIVSSSVTRITAQGSGSRGVYHFSGAVKWDPVFNSGTSLIVVGSAWSWAPSVYWKEPYGVSGSEREDIAAMLDFRARLSTTTASTYQLQVCHENGSAQTVLQAQFEIAYLGTYAGNASDSFVFA